MTKKNDPSRTWPEVARSEKLSPDEAIQVEGGGRWNPDCPLPPGTPHWDNYLYYGYFQHAEPSV